MGIISFDERRDIIVLPTLEKAIEFAKNHWVHSALRSIQEKASFAVALSGGSTPKAIYEHLALEQNNLSIDWEKLFLFWSDERAVGPDHADSNYKMAMDSGLQSLKIPKGQIFRMEAETSIEEKAKAYEDKIRYFLGNSLFDLVMLGIGEDGHTASLFPNTQALHEEKRLVLANYIDSKKSWRMTLTFPCIEQSKQAVFYAFGENKAEIIKEVLYAPILSPYPASRVGTVNHKALFILDKASASKLKF